MSELELELGFEGLLSIIAVPLATVEIKTVELVNAKTLQGALPGSPSSVLSSSSRNQSVRQVDFKIKGKHKKLPTQHPLPATLDIMVYHDGAAETKSYTLQGELVFTGGEDFEFKQRVKEKQGSSSITPTLRALEHRLFGRGKVSVRLQPQYPHLAPVPDRDIATFDNPVTVILLQNTVVSRGAQRLMLNLGRVLPGSVVPIGTVLGVELATGGLATDILEHRGAVRVDFRELDVNEKRGRGGQTLTMQWTQESRGEQVWMVGCSAGSTPDAARFTYQEADEEGGYEFGYDLKVAEDVAEKNARFTTVVEDIELLKAPRPTMTQFEIEHRHAFDLFSSSTHGHALWATGGLTGFAAGVAVNLEVSLYRRVGKDCERVGQPQVTPLLDGKFEVELHTLDLTPPRAPYRGDLALEALSGATKAGGSPLFATLRFMPGAQGASKLPLSSAVLWSSNEFDAFDEQKGVVGSTKKATSVCSREARFGCLKLRRALAFHLGPVPVLTVEQLQLVFEKASIDSLKVIVDEVVANTDRLGLDTPLRLAHFFAQARREVGSSLALVESLKYSAVALKATFSYYGAHPGEAAADAGQENVIGDKVYGPSGNASLGNATGEGFKYRGRGLLHLTGKANYADFTTWQTDVFKEAINFVENPQAVAEPKYALRAASFFWMRNHLNTKADSKGDAAVDAIAKVINKGESADGRKERRQFYNLCYRVFGVD